MESGPDLGRVKRLYGATVTRSNALADLDALITLHQRDEGWTMVGSWCATCGDASELPVDWPCETHELATRVRRALVEPATLTDGGVFVREDAPR